MKLPLLDVFVPPFEAWETRDPTQGEMFASRRPDPIRIRRIASVSDARSAAKYIAEGISDSGLEVHINTNLCRSSELKAWRSAMPSKTPTAISSYQKNHEKSDLSAVSREVEKYGCVLSPGQSLFHGGLWASGFSMITTRPLSTSLSPQVAFNNALWKGKAYDGGRIDLMVLRVVAPKTKAFVFKRRGTSLGHEKEVLLASGATLTLVSETLIRGDFPASKYEQPEKAIPVYVLEMELS